MNFLTLKKNSVSSCKKLKNPLVIAIILLDIAFIFSYGMAANFFVEKIQESVFAVVNTAGQESAALAPEAAANPYLGTLRQNPTIDRHIRTIALQSGLFMLTIYLLYCLFQGLNWKLTAKLFKKTFTLKNFFIVNLLWFGIFYIVQGVDFFRLLTESIQIGFDEAVAIDVTTAFFIIAYVTIAYFALISYTFLGSFSPKEAIKKALKIGTSSWKNTIPVFLIIVLLFFLIDRLLFFTHSIQPLWFVAGGFGLMGIAWARIFLLNSLSRL